MHRSPQPAVSRSALWALSVLLLLGLLTAGCGGSGQPTITPAAAPTPTATRPATSSPTTTPAPIATNTVYGTVQDAQGNHAVISVGVGSPTPLEKLSDPVATACNSTITSAGLSIASAVAIPMHVTARLTSSLKTPLDVNLSEVAYLEIARREVEALSNRTNLAELWASSGLSGPQCPSTGSEAAEVRWTAEAITPNTTQTWDAWLIVAGVITPNDPTGEKTIGRVLIRPGAGIGSGYTNRALTRQGSGWLGCFGGEAQYVAVDQTAAKADGC